MAVSEGKVCRGIIDRHDVIKHQVIETIRESLRSGLTSETEQTVFVQIEELFRIHTDGLVGNISKQFSE
jgi:hypothetical protein